MASLNDMQRAPGEAPIDPELQGLIDSLSEDDFTFDEGLFGRIVDRQRVALFGGDTPEGELSAETMAQLESDGGQAGPAGKAVNAAVEATLSVLIGAEESGVEIPPLEGFAAAYVCVNDVAEALDAMGAPLSPEQGVQAIYATLENVMKRGVDRGVWDPDEAAVVIAAIQEDPELFDEGLRSVDPAGAAVIEAAASDVEAERAAGMAAEQGAVEGPPPAGRASGAPLNGLRTGGEDIV